MKKLMLDWSKTMSGRRGFIAGALVAAACAGCLSLMPTRSAGTEYVDVPEGGESYTISCLSASDESGRFMAQFGFYS